MIVERLKFTVQTRGRGTYDLSREVREFVAGTAVKCGTCHVFVHHTSASLMLCENADPDVLRDMETWLAGAVVDGDGRFRHRDEGDDDMSGHVRTMLTGSDLTIPVDGGRPDLGTWQGVYLYEHRYAPHSRKVTLTVIGK